MTFTQKVRPGADYGTKPDFSKNFGWIGLPGIAKHLLKKKNEIIDFLYFVMTGYLTFQF